MEATMTAFARSFEALLALALALSPVVAAGQQVYRWVDDDGNVHFGDAPPQGPVRQEERLKLKVPPAPATDKDADYYSVTNQARRINEDLTKMREQRAEKQRKARQEAPQPMQPMQPPDDEYIGDGNYYPYAYPPPYYPGYGYRPHHPGYGQGGPGYGGGHGRPGHGNRPPGPDYEGGRGYNRPTGRLHF
jgi:hypothetical protein